MQADPIAERVGKGFASDELATREFVRAEIAAQRTELHARKRGARLRDCES
jgi:hypothetical protein